MDFLATEPQYLDHLAPVWKALERDERRWFHVPRFLIPHALVRGIDSDRLAKPQPAADDRLLVVASYKDARRAPQRRVALLEHGAGQTYSDSHPSGPGGEGRQNVALFLCTNEDVAERNWRAYPAAQHRVVGCPKLDAWHDGGLRLVSMPPTVAVSFHWNSNQAPEAGWAFDHYVNELPSVVAAHPGALGHAHPRAFRFLEPAFEWAGLEPVDDFEQVLLRADLYVCDNSSTLFEFAATGRPVLVLNAPAYRRDVNHGLRFWSHVPGLQCDEPADLLHRIAEALEDRPEQQALRHRAVERAYGALDGKATQRAVSALRGAVSG